MVLPFSRMATGFETGSSLTGGLKFAELMEVEVYCTSLVYFLK